jgi:hypothetical protein
VLARLPQQPVHQRIKRALAALRWIERTPLSLVHGHSVLPTPADAGCGCGPPRPASANLHICGSEGPLHWGRR